MSDTESNTEKKAKKNALQQVAKFAFNLSAGILLPYAKRRMDEGIDNEAMDTSDSVEEIDQSYSPDIIDDIEQQIKQDPEQTVSGISLEDGVPESELDIVATGNDSDLSDTDVFDRNETSPDIPTGFHVDGPSTSATQQSPSGSQQTLQTIQITLRRHQSSGFGFRPASGVGPEPIVASVIQGSSAARHGLKIGDRIRSVCIPTENGPHVYHTITAVQQIKDILGHCQSFVTLCVFRDMEQIDTEVELEPLTPLGLGLQTTNIGIFVTSVQPGSIGDIFGYRFGDQILSINEHPVHDSDDIRRIRRRSLRDIEQRRAKKRIGLFRSVSSLSTSSRAESAQDARPTRERIRVSIGRRNIETLSEHPIAAIWSENEHRNSPLNILEPVYDDLNPQNMPSAPDPALLEDSAPTTTAPLPSLVEEDLINELRNLGSTSSFKSPETQILPSTNEKPSVVSSSSDEPFLFTHIPAAELAKRPPNGEKLPTSTDVDLKCVVCLDGVKEIVFQPCWHQVTCPECAVRLKECPLCREIIAIRRRPYRC